MRYPRLSESGGKGRQGGRWFGLVFLCAVLVLALAPATCLAHHNGWPSWHGHWPNSHSKILLAASRTLVAAGSPVTLTASVRQCPWGAVITLQAKGSTGPWTTVATTPAKWGKATFNVAPLRNTAYQAQMTCSRGGAQTSNVVCVRVMAKLTVCAQPGTYGVGGMPVVISGTLVPAWPGGQVRITIATLTRCWHTHVVACLTVPLTPGTGDSSMYATTWPNGVAHTCYVITAMVSRTADFWGGCASTRIRL